MQGEIRGHFYPLDCSAFFTYSAECTRVFLIKQIAHTVGFLFSRIIIWLLKYLGKKRKLANVVYRTMVIFVLLQDLFSHIF